MTRQEPRAASGKRTRLGRRATGRRTARAGRGQDKDGAQRADGAQCAERRQVSDGVQRADGTRRERRVVEKKVRFFYWGKLGNKLLREEGKGRKKERSGRRLLLRISVARTASLHIPSSLIPVGAKGRGLAGTRCVSSPPLGPSSREGSPYGCWPLWVTSLVYVHRLHLGKVLFGFPCWVRKSPPLHQILQPSSHPPTVQNLFYLRSFSFNDYWQGWREHLTRKGVVCSGV